MNFKDQLMGLFWLLALLLSQSGLAAVAAPGPAFSDPDGLVVKSAEWQKGAIQYQEWGKTAQLALVLDQHLYTGFMPIIEDYAKAHGVEIAVREGTCGNAEGLLKKKNVDMAGFCCPPALSDRLPGLQFHSVGIVGLAILLHQENPVKNLSAQQVRDLFSGKISNWSQVMPEAQKAAFSLPVLPVGRLHCPTRPGHWRLILNDKEQFSPNMASVGVVADMISSVANYRGAIGYEILWNVARFGQENAVKSVLVNGVSVDDADALVAGKYPFFRVNTVTLWQNPENAKPQALKLLRYIESQVPQMPSGYHIVPTQRLRQAGWPFKGDELIGLPPDAKQP